VNGYQQLENIRTNNFFVEDGGIGGDLKGIFYL